MHNHYHYHYLQLPLPSPPTSQERVNDGIDTIHPYYAAVDGHWLPNLTSPDVYPCPGGTQACPITSESEGLLCGDGYTGPLCGVCEDGFGPTQSGGLTLCEECPAEAQNTLLGFFGTIFAIAFICVFVDSTLQKADDINLGTAILSKILLNNVQFLVIAAKLPYRWPNKLQLVLNAQVDPRSPFPPPKLTHPNLP